MPLGAFSDGPKVACGCRHQQTHARSPHIVYIQCTDSGKENTVSGTCQPMMLIHVWLNFIIVAFNKQSSEGKTHPEGSALSRGHKKCPSAEVRNRKKQMSYSLKKVIFSPRLWFCQIMMTYYNQEIEVNQGIAMTLWLVTELPESILTFKANSGKVFFFSKIRVHINEVISGIHF